MRRAVREALNLYLMGREALDGEALFETRGGGPEACDGALTHDQRKLPAA